MRTLTGRGLTFLVLGMGLTLAGMLLGHRDLLRSGVLLVVLVLLARVFTWWRLPPVAATRHLTPAQLVVGEPARVELTVATIGRRGLARSWALDRVDPAWGDAPSLLLADGGAGASYRAAYDVRPSVRGRHTLGPLVVHLGDPFGLSGARRRADGVDTVLVLPRVHTLPDTPREIGIGDRGVPTRRRHRTPDDDQSLREYEIGDDIRRIHWPATARWATLMVRFEDRPVRRHAVIVLDSRRRVTDAMGPGGFDWAVDMVASIAAHLENVGYAVHGVTLSPGRLPRVVDDPSAVDLRTTLALTAPAGEASLGPLVAAGAARVREGCFVVVVTGAVAGDDPHAWDALRERARVGAALVVTPAHSRRDFGSARVAALRTTGWTAHEARAGSDAATVWDELTSNLLGSRQ